MAIVARSFQTPTDCGHSVAWETLVESTSTTDDGCSTAVQIDAWSKPRTSCPVCQAPVGFASDQGTDNGDNAVTDTVPIVFFKYGKMVYRLSVPAVTSAAAAKKQDSLAVVVHESWWQTIPRRLGFSTDTSHLKDQSLHSDNTAQARIQSFLGISHGMKVSDNWSTTALRVD
jgi:hypothetical protein